MLSFLLLVNLIGIFNSNGTNLTQRPEYEIVFDSRTLHPEPNPGYVTIYVRVGSWINKNAIEEILCDIISDISVDNLERISISFWYCLEYDFTPNRVPEPPWEDMIAGYLWGSYPKGDRSDGRLTILKDGGGIEYKSPLLKEFNHFNKCLSLKK